MTVTRRTLIAAALAAALAGPAAAQTELTLGHVGEPGSLFDQSAQLFAERANALLGDKAKVVVYGSSQLGSDGDMLKKLKLGTITMALPSTVMSSAVPAFGMFEMPYLVKNRAHMVRIREEVVKPSLVPLAEAEGYTILGVWENGFRHITNNARPIATPADLAGIKLRVPGGEWRVKMFEAYGAQPSPLALSEVFVALQTGVMDGQENPYAQIYPSRFYEVQKFLSNTGHVYTPAYLTAGRAFAALPEDVQAALRQAAVEVEPEILALAERLENELLVKLKETGIAVNEVDKDAFVAASKPVYDAFAAEVEGGGALVEKAITLGAGS